MKTPLRVLVPVHNAQPVLAAAIADALDVIGEWADRFELVVIDDASTDDTLETAVELAARYPQLRLLRHSTRLGLAEAVDAVLGRAGSEIVLLGRDAYQLNPQDLRDVWRLRDAERALDTISGSTSLAQLGFQVIRRAAFDQLRLDHARDTIARIDAAGRTAGSATRGKPNFVGRLKRFALGE